MLAKVSLWRCLFKDTFLKSSKGRKRKEWEHRRGRSRGNSKLEPRRGSGRGGRKKREKVLK